MSDGRINYPLKHPVELKNKEGQVVETITELNLRRLKGRDMRQAIDGAKGQGAMTLALLARSAGLPPSTIDELDGEDITAAGAIVADFLGGSLPTGET